LNLVPPAAVSTRMAELGLGGIRVDRSEKAISIDLKKPGGVERFAVDARDTTTPDDMANLLIAFYKGRDGLTRESHALLLRWMEESPTGPRKLRAGAPAGAVVAHKSGQMPGTSNDVGIITSPDGKQHFVVAIFTKGSKVDDAKLADADIAAAVRAIYAELVQ
jgi:beta-lactamase class A